jgi:hypothetical protein
VWVYFAIISKSPHTYSFTLFNAAAPSSQTTPGSAAQLRLWNTSGVNRIILGYKEFYASCDSTLKFKDVRVYTDLSSVSLPGASFAQLKSQCQSNCLACSDVEVCSSCETGFYQEGGLCKGCSINCKTCSGPSSCLSYAADFILSAAGSCGSACPSGTFAAESRCQVCPASCQTCTSSVQCSLCKADFYQLQLNDSVSCLQKCPQGYFTDQTACKPCASPCKTCTGSTIADAQSAHRTSSCSERRALSAQQAPSSMVKAVQLVTCSARAAVLHGLVIAALKASLSAKEPVWL